MRLSGILFALTFFMMTINVSGQDLYIYEDHFDSVSSMNNWHHTTDYRGGGQFEVFDGQFQRTQVGHVFYYNNSFKSGTGTYEFKAKGPWVFFWRGTTEDSTIGKAIAISAADDILWYGEVDWFDYVYGYHNNTRSREESVSVGQYLTDSLNNIRIVDDSISAKIYVNDQLHFDLTISPAYRNFGYVEIGCNHQPESTAFDDIVVSVKAAQSYHFNNNWNMISVPLSVSDFTKTVIFPTSVSNAFAFDIGYAAYGILENGRGYWLKFPSEQTVSMTGAERTEDTIAVTEGWNMIGSLSTSIPISNVGSIPGGMITGNFFTYNGQYEIASSLEPGKGYWIKVLQTGHLVLSSSGNILPTNRIKIIDTGETPPDHRRNKQ